MQRLLYAYCRSEGILLREIRAVGVLRTPKVEDYRTSKASCPRLLLSGSEMLKGRGGMYTAL